MYLSKKKLLMLLSIMNGYLKQYSWKDLEILREEIIGKLV